MARQPTIALHALNAAALAEFRLITRLGLVERVDGPGKPKTDGELSAHVLDIASLLPAGNVAIVLRACDGNSKSAPATTATNAQRRADEPLLHGAPLRIGVYEIAFH